MALVAPEKINAGPYVIGDIMEVTNDFGSEKYLITRISTDKFMELRKVRLGKTKISAIRFPNTLRFRVIYHSTHA
jgi:hypothetical protein